MPTITSARLEGGMKFIATMSTGHELVMDAAEQVGGDNSGARPGSVPYAGLAGCTGMDVISILRKMRQDVTSFAVEVEGLEKTEEHPKHWVKIRVIFKVEGEVEAAKLIKAINLSRTRYCGVSAIMRPSMEMQYSYLLNGEAGDVPDPE